MSILGFIAAGLALGYIYKLHGSADRDGESLQDRRPVPIPVDAEGRLGNSRSASPSGSNQG